MKYHTNVILTWQFICNRNKPRLSILLVVLASFNMQTEVCVKKNRLHNFFPYLYSSHLQSSLNLVPYVFVVNNNNNNNNNNKQMHLNHKL